MKLKVKDISGNDNGELEVGFDLVEGGKGTQAVHDSVVAYRAAQRSGTACTKTMGDVAGSGKKPWRQKGTGRARAGSFASPLWRGGGVVFGPKPRDFSKTISRKTKQLALRKALSERLNAGDVILVDEIKLDAGKTKGFLGVLSKLGLNDTVLVVSPAFEPGVRRAARNLRHVELASGADLNCYQVLKSDKLLFTRAGFNQVEERLKS